MIRYDTICNDCKGETIVYSHKQISIKDIKCSHCKSSNMKLIAYYNSVETQLIALQHHISYIEQIVDRILDSMGYNISEGDVPKDNLTKH